MAWETDESGEAAFEKVKDFAIEFGTFDEPPGSYLLIRLELDRRSIQFALTVNQAVAMIALLKERLP